jgi:hypothetical protein
MMRQETGLANAYAGWFAACLALLFGLVPILPLLPAAYGVCRSYRGVKEWHPPVRQGLLKIIWWRLARLGVVSAVLFTWLTAALIAVSQIAMFVR